MKGKNRKQTVALPFVLLIILILLLFPIPTTLAGGQTEDQIIFTFDPRPNEPPSPPITPDPSNGSVDVPVPVTLSVDVYDESSSVVDVYFYNASNDALIDVDYNVSSDWGTASVVWNESLDGRICYWYAIARDHEFENRSETWIFATRPNQPPIIHNDEYPANTSTNVSIATPYWYVTIEDPENDAFNWTIETSPNIGNASGNNDVNGQKSCPLSGLQYNTNYAVYVNATDTGSGKWTNETFWFITAEQGAPTISNEYPPHRNTQTELQPICHVDVHDIEGDNLILYWYENTSGSWVLRQTDSNVSANSTVYWTFSQANAYSTTYYWRVTVNDSTTNTTGTYYFTTKPQPSAPPSPPGPGYTPPPNRHPIANITGSNIGYVNETLIFYAYYSYDPDGYIVGYRWDFENDGVYDTEWLEDFLITCNYSKPGNYTIRLQVKDNDGAITTSDPHSIHIVELEPPLQLPIPQINGPYYGYTNESLTFSSEGSYDPDGTIINYTWDFGDGNKSYLKNPVHSYAEPGNYTVILTVTDNDNLSNSTTTKAFIIDKEVKEPEERKLPLYLLIYLIIAIIITIIVIILTRELPKKPIISITSPKNGDTVSGAVPIAGTASVPEGKEIRFVEIRIDGRGERFKAQGTIDWSYEWDSKMVSNGVHKIEARCSDGDNEGFDSISVTVDNKDANWYRRNVVEPMKSKKLDASKKNRNKNKNVDAKADKDRDIDAKVDKLLLELDKNTNKK